MNPTKKEKLYWDRLAELGCIVCLTHSGITNNYVSIHHIDGRTKKGCHMNVLALCAPHHMTGKRGVAIHPYKHFWEETYGTQESLRIISNKLLEDD